MRMLSLMLLVLASGCATASPDAVCDGTRAATADLARALADSPDDAAVVAGQRLIAQLDAGCGR